MALAGYITENVFLCYIKVNEDELADRLEKHWTKINNES
jgi:hypothetical protein